jgi:hypothetical protein
MSLIAFQTALGRTIRARTTASLACDDLDLSPQERRSLDRVIHSAGFRTTMNIQRSWCEARSASGAQLTLSVLPLEQRRHLVGEWVDSGGGTNSFFAAEAEAFLRFIEPRLLVPSHALSLCRLEQAVLRAEAVATGFAAAAPAALGDLLCALCTGRNASLVGLFAEPADLLAAVQGQSPLPPLSPCEQFLLVAPGVPGLARPAEAPEIALWRALAAPRTVGHILQGHTRITLETLWRAGVIEAA